MIIFLHLSRLAIKIPHYFIFNLKNAWNLGCKKASLRARVDLPSLDFGGSQDCFNLNLWAFFDALGSSNNALQIG